MCILLILTLQLFAEKCFRLVLVQLQHIANLTTDKSLRILEETVITLVELFTHGKSFLPMTV